jgi:hypothetical protein
VLFVRGAAMPQTQLLVPSECEHFYSFAKYGGIAKSYILTTLAAGVCNPNERRTDEPILEYLLAGRLRNSLGPGGVSLSAEHFDGGRSS